jgi:hypothetical protein
VKPLGERPRALETLGLDRVRRRRCGRHDIFDLALTGRSATIVSVEPDHDDRVYVTVTWTTIPAGTWGADGKPGHRFSFDPEEAAQPPARKEPAGGKEPWRGVKRVR